MTTTWLPGQVRVDSGVTVKLPVVWALRTGNVCVWLTSIVSCYLVARRADGQNPVSDDLDTYRSQLQGSKAIKSAKPRRCETRNRDLALSVG